MKVKLVILAVLSILLLTPLAQADMHKCTARDLTLAAHAARQAEAPILLLYSSQECGYCELLKRQVLKPMFGQDQDNRLAVVRELDMDTGGKLVDFDGEKIRSRRLQERYHVRVTPTLLILDAKGQLLADPIVGYDSPEAYRTRLESLLARSHKLLRAAGFRQRAISSLQ